MVDLTESCVRARFRITMVVAPIKKSASRKPEPASCILDDVFVAFLPLNGALQGNDMKDDIKSLFIIQDNNCVSV
jgi:hypothetical protein